MNAAQRELVVHILPGMMMFWILMGVLAWQYGITMPDGAQYCGLTAAYIVCEVLVKVLLAIVLVPIGLYELTEP